MVSVLQNEQKKFNKSSIALKVLCCIHFHFTSTQFWHLSNGLILIDTSVVINKPFLPFFINHN